MKVCQDHLSKVRRGSTYQLVSKEECVFCTNNPNREILRDLDIKDFRRGSA